ncbi:BTB/POZ and MATH domain-containing protein 2 [Hordeum vulgare]|nr:BTB/POZ and MATH domain-containing protein 2 [Hordeum vulgare]
MVVISSDKREAGAASSSLGPDTACTPETAHGVHLFKINWYSLYRELGVDGLIQSSTFAVGGYNCDVGPAEFDSSDDTAAWGFRDFLKKSELEDYILDDALLIGCNLVVIKFNKARVQTEMKFEVHVPLSNLLDHLGNLLETQEGADVSYKVRGEVFPAHKIILAMQSPVFKAQFYGPMKNKCGRSIAIEDMQPAVFKALLHFIYTDSLSLMDRLNDDDYVEMLKHLLVAADRYAMERMKFMCETAVDATTMPDNVTLLPKSILAHQTPNHQGATPSRFVAFNVQDEAPLHRRKHPLVPRTRVHLQE